MKTMHETTGAGPDVDAEVVEVSDGDQRRRRTLILAAVLSVAPAVLATTLAIVRRRRAGNLQPAAGPRPAAPRQAPQSTINVNWGFALFGTNVMAERRRRAGGLFGRLARRR
jgi:hypothetical protein